jgi:hypothetical protein
MKLIFVSEEKSWAYVHEVAEPNQ